MHIINKKTSSHSITVSLAGHLKLFASGLLAGFGLRNRRRSLICTLALAGSVAYAKPIDAVAPTQQILIQPKPQLTEQALQTLMSVHGAKQVDSIRQINVRVLRVPAANRDKVLEALSHNPNIEFAEPDYIVAHDAVPNDPYFSNGSEWHLPKIQAPQAWDVTTGRSSVVVAILDTGVDGSHPDLVERLVPGWNFYDNNSNTSDVYGHGTAVAGTAVASSNNGIGVAAVAWGCRLMPLRISDLNGYGYASTISKALTWAADNGARVANISYRIDFSSSVSTAAQYFMSKGGVVTMSAGNEAAVYNTAEDPSILVVSATDSVDKLATWSNTGNNVDLAAPGVSIRTTNNGGSYGSWSGTSFSAPIVAGVSALVLSVNPTLTGAKVRDILCQSVDDFGAVGYDPSYGYGRANAFKAVLASGGTVPTDTMPPTVSITSPTGGSTVSGTVVVNVSSSDNVGVSKVEFYWNGVLKGTSAMAVTGFSWNTLEALNGNNTLEARAYDAAGNMASSGVITVNVQNVSDTVAPTTQITSPTANAIVSTNTKIYAIASDNVGVTRVELYIDQKFFASSTSSAPVFSWNTRKTPKGQHALQTIAYDAMGNAGASPVVMVVK